MAVQSVFYSDRDGLEKALKNPETMTFASKAEADERDKMLEFAEEVSEFLKSRVDGLGDEVAEQCGVVLAENRELLKKAIKRPSLLNEGASENAD
jgi:uncharacterized protein